MSPVRKILSNCMAAAVLSIAGQVVAADSPTKEARITQIIRDVELLLSKATPRPAVVEDKVREDTAVQTGIDSRAELTFADLTITRLGETTIFTFNTAARDFDLSSGSILLWVPKNSGAAHIRGRAVTVGITGTTVIFQSSPAGHSRLVVLEGRARLSLNNYPSESADIMAGQMLDVEAGATKLPPPIDIDLSLLMKTAPLITDFPPLPSQDLILSASQHQGKLVNVPTAPASPSPAGTSASTIVALHGNATESDLGRELGQAFDAVTIKNSVAISFTPGIPTPAPTVARLDQMGARPVPSSCLNCHGQAWLDAMRYRPVPKDKSHTSLPDWIDFSGSGTLSRTPAPTAVPGRPKGDWSESRFPQTSGTPLPTPRQRGKPRKAPPTTSSSTATPTRTQGGAKPKSHHLATPSPRPHYSAVPRTFATPPPKPKRVRTAPPGPVIR